MEEEKNTETEFNDLGIGFFKYLLRPEERFELVNTALAKILKYNSKNTLRKLKFKELFIDKESYREFLKVLNKNNKIKFFETRLKLKSGLPLWVSFNALLKRDSYNAEWIEGAIEDISAHKEAEEKTALERDMFQGLLDNIPDAVYFKDTKNRLLRVNKFYQQGLSLAEKDILGKTDFDFFPSAQAEEMQKDDNFVLETAKPVIGKIERTLLPNGTWNQVITTKIPMYGRSGEIIGTMGITRDMTAYARLEEERSRMTLNILTVLGKALQMRDPYTFKHTQNVAMITEEVAKYLGWEENKLLAIKLAAQIHDLGKISIPLEILNKPGRLSDLEHQLIRTHVENCSTLINDVDFPFNLNDIVCQHHERLNGSGYPKGLKDEDICIEAKILAVSDVLESMTSHRPYRAALGVKKALEELNAGCGIRYDRETVGIVSELVDKNNGEPFWLKS